MWRSKTSGIMASTLLLLHQLLLVSLASAHLFYGGTSTFTYKGKNSDGSFIVNFHSRATFSRCQSLSWSCYKGNCGSTTTTRRGVIDRSMNALQNGSEWCETETVTTTFVRDQPFQLRASGCCWSTSSESHNDWSLQTNVDLGKRSDTNQPNRSPKVAILPLLRVAQNCPRRYQLMSSDPDGDRVQCKYEIINRREENHESRESRESFESGRSWGSNHPGFTLDQDSCTLNYQFVNGTLRENEFEVAVEDFPKQRTTLTYSDGSQSVRDPLNTRRKRHVHDFKLRSKYRTPPPQPAKTTSTTTTMEPMTMTTTEPTTMEPSVPMELAPTTTRDPTTAEPLVTLETTTTTTEPITTTNKLAIIEPTATTELTIMEPSVTPEPTTATTNEVVTIESTTMEPSVLIELALTVIATEPSNTTRDPTTMEQSVTTELEPLTTTNELATIELTTTTTEPTIMEPSVTPTTTTNELVTIEPTTTTESTIMEPSVPIEPVLTLTATKQTTMEQSVTTELEPPTTTNELTTIEPTTTTTEQTIMEPSVTLEPTTTNEVVTIEPTIMEPSVTPEPTTTTTELTTIEPTTTTTEQTIMEPSMTLEPTTTNEVVTIEPTIMEPSVTPEQTTNTNELTTIEPTTTTTEQTIMEPITTTTIEQSVATEPALTITTTEMKTVETATTSTTRMEPTATSAFISYISTTTLDPTISSLSKLPLYFFVLVDDPAPSCEEGDYLPTFVDPTPENGAVIQAVVSRELEIKVKATAANSEINDIIISGPQEINKHKTTHNEFVMRWTPTPEDVDDQSPICFAVESVDRSRVYQSEMRCVLVAVRKRQIKTNVVCTESTMMVAIEKSSLSGINEDHLQLSDSFNTLCSLQRHSNRTHIVGVIPLNACGTQIEEDEDDLLFKNEIITVDNTRDLITRKDQLEVKFYCQYPKRSNVTLSFTAHRAAVTVWDKGFGSFTYNFEFYSSERFRQMIDPSSYPLEFDTGSRMFIEIEANSSVANTELFVESCRAAPYDNANSQPTYSIIENGCNVDPSIRTYPSADKREFKFSIEAFKFIGLQDQVYISCSVVMCEAGNPNTRCSQGCVMSQESHRVRKRGAGIQSARHFISQGPLRFKRSLELNTMTNLNVNLLFIVGCLLAAVGTVCGVVFYRSKMKSIKYQPLSTFKN